ncbi:hypothetical protein P4E94_09830 [Pontiellaceae bacterium B12219]|nr:hypothetical protein [Pontiellaceae bacterium B12219]
MKFIKSIFGAGALLMAASSQAAVIAYDNFPLDGALDGSTGGSGFTNAWSGGSYTIAGGVVSGTGNSLRSLSSPLGSNGTIWVSFDFGVDNNLNSYGGLSFFEGSVERLLIGDYYGQDVWGLDGKAGSTKSKSTVSTTGIKTGAAKITLGAGAASIVELWVGTNNTDAVDCSGLPDVTVSSVNLANVDTLRIGAGFQMNFSDLILATTAAEVGAVQDSGTVYAAGASGSWTNSANWSAGVPTASDAATIDIGANVTLETEESIESLRVKTSADLTIADGGKLTVIEEAEFGAATLTFGIGAGSSGTLDVMGPLDISAATLALDGNLDGAQRVIATADELVGEFGNYADAAFVQNSAGVNYYIFYVTNSEPNYIEINTNGAQFAEVVLPPRPTEQLIIDGFDQRYMAYDYNPSSGVWTDSVSSAQNATASNIAGFSITTNTPNGRPAVVNVDNGLDMAFTRSSALSSTGFTIQAVIRIDSGNTDDRQGPYGLAQAGGWGGLYMGLRAADDGNSDIRAGNLGNTGTKASALLIENASSTMSTDVWGIYTLTVDPMSTTQLVAQCNLLSDGSNVFTHTLSVADATNWVGAIGTAGGLFAGERGSALGDTDNWQGAIADLVVYNRVLAPSELADNQAAFQTIYQVPVTYPTSIGDVSIEMISGGADVVISWATSEYGTFALEATDSLTFPVWGNVATGIPGTGSEVSVTTIVSEAASFYRAYIEDESMN